VLAATNPVISSADMAMESFISVSSIVEPSLRRKKQANARSETI
jgi:hypothetical protein